MVKMQRVSPFFPRVNRATPAVSSILTMSNFRYIGSFRVPKGDFDVSPSTWATFGTRQQNSGAGWNPVNGTLVIAGAVQTHGGTPPAPCFAEILPALPMIPADGTQGSIETLNTALWYYSSPGSPGYTSLATNPFAYCGDTTNTTSPNDPGAGVEGNGISATTYPGVNPQDGNTVYTGFYYYYQPSGDVPHVYTAYVADYDVTPSTKVVYTRADNLQGKNNIGGMCNVVDTLNNATNPRSNCIYGGAIPADWQSRFSNKKHFTGGEGGGFLSGAGNMTYGVSFFALNFDDVNASNVLVNYTDSTAVPGVSYVWYDAFDQFPDFDLSSTMATSGAFFYSKNGKAGIVWVGGRFTTVNWYGYQSFAQWLTATQCNAGGNVPNFPHVPGYPAWTGSDPNIGATYGMGPFYDGQWPIPLTPLGQMQNRNLDGSPKNPTYPGQPADFVQPQNDGCAGDPRGNVSTPSMLCGVDPSMNDLGYYYIGTTSNKGQQVDGTTPHMWIGDPGAISNYINNQGGQPTGTAQFISGFHFDELKDVNGNPCPLLATNSGPVAGVIYDGNDTIYVISANMDVPDTSSQVGFPVIHVYTIVT